MSKHSLLRAIANRLTSCATEDLPHQIGYLSASIASCSDVLSDTRSGDNAVVIHKIKTKTSALLQDRTVEGRLAGIIISKALVEAGGLAILSESNLWVRSLITCLNKPDPWEVKKLCLLTISRIYLLTASYQALVREITTPTLPTFINSTLNLINSVKTSQHVKLPRSSNPLLITILRCWTNLIENFASTFRPSVSAIRTICYSVLSVRDCSSEIQATATLLLARLHFCTPKNTATQSWVDACTQTIEAMHGTADLVFRAVVEDWKPVITRTSSVTRKQKAASIPATDCKDVLGLDKWNGLGEGFDRLETQLDVLTNLFTTPHSQDFALPLGAALDLTSRLSAMTPPTNKFSLKTNSEITREEREDLWLNLPKLHAKVLGLFGAMAETFGQSLYPVAHSIVQQFWDIFDSQRMIPAIRSSSFSLMNILLGKNLLTIRKADSTNLRHLVASLCDDLGSVNNSEATGETITNGTTANNGGSHLNIVIDSASKKNQPARKPGDQHLFLAAWQLLPVLVERVPFHVITSGSTLRAKIDSLAILLQHKEAILSSVLYPLRPFNSASGKSGLPNPSLLPFLARSADSANAIHISYASSSGVEALLRPRLPLVSTVATVTQDDEEEDMEEDEGFGDSEAIQTDTMGNENIKEPSAPSPIDLPLISKDPDIQNSETLRGSGTKRDLAALLEATTDNQTASLISVDRDLTDVKRPRGSSNIQSELRQDEQKTPIPQSILEPILQEESLSSTTIPLEDVHRIEPDVTSAAHRAGELDQSDGDSDSDSDIPLIDATLAVFTDSEDEDDE